jgi:hypothetical protein
MMKEVNKWEPNYTLIMAVIVMLFTLVYIVSAVTLFPANAESDCPGTVTPTVTVTPTPTDNGLPTPAPTSNVTPEPWHKLYLPMFWVGECSVWNFTCYDEYCEWSCQP